METIHQELTRLRRQMNYFRLYAIITSILIFACIGYGFHRSAQDDIIKNLRAENIEIVESDGTVKLALFNKEHLPPAMINGKKISRQGGDESGLMFYNTEGEECGGLIFSGNGKNGQGQNELSITFDQYKQDQVVQLSYIQRENGQTMAIIDSIKTNVKDPAEQRKIMDKLSAQGYFGHIRMFAGQQGQRTGVFVRDDKGRIRLEMIVNERNEPEIMFYDEKGEVRKRVDY